MSMRPKHRAKGLGEPVRTTGPQHRVPPCGNTWVCQVVIALREIAQATALHSQKEVKADHEAECPVAGAFRQGLCPRPPPELGAHNKRDGKH